MVSSFLFYRLGQTVISSLELSRHLCVNYVTACVLHNNILSALTPLEEAYKLRRKIHIDYAYHGGDLPCGKDGRGLEHNIPFVPSVSFK
jgi:hypothetical protein